MFIPFNSKFALVAVSVVLVLTSIFGVSNAIMISPRATVCNGQAEFCSRNYGNITFVGAHDSYAIGPTSQLGANQDQNVTQQLNDGVRMLQMQALLQNNEIFLCHTSCSLFNGGSLQDYLTIVKKWLDANPNEVLTLLIVNINNLPPTQYDTVFKAVGLDTISFVPSATPITASGWPTLGSMINSGKRLVTFMDNGATSAVPYILDEFTNMWETAFDVTNPAFDCNVNRTQGDAATQLSTINHFLDTTILNQLVPDIQQLNVTNAASGTGSLGAQAGVCVAQNGRAPNFLLVDFYEFGGGSVFQVAATLNGVTYQPATPIATPVPTSSSSGSSGSSNAGLPRVHVTRRELGWGLLIVLSSVIFGGFSVI